MNSEFGDRIKVSIFGQSHSKGIGAVITGLPAGLKLDMDLISAHMQRRAPGRNLHSTQRKEADIPNILSGLANGVTTGDPLCAVIENTNTISSDYDSLRDTPRPSHSDYPLYVKTGGYNDISGGGHSSGRLTAPLCFAGAVCMQILGKFGIEVGAHIYSVGDSTDTPFDMVNISAKDLADIKEKEFPTVSDDAGRLMRTEIEKARLNLDSLGGIIECAVINLPAGLGDPMFSGVENKLASAVFGIPAVRGIEFGAGFAAAKMTGSEHNDPYRIKNGRIVTETNNHGGIIGGITTGMPLVFRAAIKPTASIAQEQNTVSLSELTETKLTIKGRHDPCIVPRAVPVVESVAAIVMADLLTIETGYRNMCKKVQE